MFWLVQVTFSVLPYRECVQRRDFQDRIVKGVTIMTGLTLLVGLLVSQSRQISDWITKT
jgi:hypothetical protein